MAPQKTQKVSANDRLSALPDDVLCNILSMLSTYEAVSTTILSSRFKNLWTNISHLTFDDDLPPFNCQIFPNTNKLSKVEFAKNQNTKIARFAKFINMVLLPHNQHSLEKLSLQICKNTREYGVNGWVSSAIMKGIKSLELLIEEDDPVVQLPSSLFTCKTLENLSLKGRSIFINTQTTYYLPNLRKLKLAEVIYKNNESARKLISSCVSLESLVVQRGCNFDNVSSFTICSSTLRDLKFTTFFSKYFDKKVEIDSPALHNLELDGNITAVFPSEVFSFEWLEVLVLNHISITTDGLRSIYLPNLRILELRNMAAENNFDFFSDLIYLVGKSIESLVIEERYRIWENSKNL